MDEKYLSKKLESMSRKGLIFRTRRADRTLYNTAPFMIGLYEYSVKNMDEELAALYKEYYDTAYQKEMGASDIPGFKVIPINSNIGAETSLFPFMKIQDQVMKAVKISVTECICRKEARMTGGGCDHPLETCLSFGAAADYYIENGTGREIAAAEALDILERADQSGLVHAGVNTMHLSNICNCCPCCCASMKGITKKRHNKRKYFNALFEACIDEGKCTGCKACMDRCPVKAVSVDGIARINRDRCLGCGLCSKSCPVEAITLQERKDREEPFRRVIDLGLAILQAKRKQRL